jgi:hypothetical protein
MARAKSKNYIDETKKAMDSLGVYKPEYGKLIEIYAGLLDQYEMLIKMHRDQDFAPTEETAAGGVKSNPVVKQLETLRKDILAYSDRLCLNPKAFDSTNIKPAPAKSKLDNVMELLNSG